MTDYKPTFANADHRYMVTRWRYDEKHDADEDTPATTLKEAEKFAFQMDTDSAKYTVRVYDADGNIVIYLMEPYGGVTVDRMKDDWLGDIQEDYSLPDDVFRKAIEHWLQEHPTDAPNA